MTTRKIARAPVRYQLLALMLILFSGCGSMPEKVAQQLPMANLYTQAREYESHGDLLGAAEIYERIAQHLSSPAREGHLLEAASLLSRGQYNDRAKALIASLDTTQLSTDQNLRLRLIQARIAINENHPKLALEQLQLPSVITLPADLQQEWQTLSAEAKARSLGSIAGQLQGETAALPAPAIALNQPHNIALLLPLTGAFSNQAAAVRDGFLAAYYDNHGSDYTPAIHIYDTTDNADIGNEVYHQALQEGADFIVGPLHKPLLERISLDDEISVPTLGLNYLSDDNLIVANLYQYGLLPEDEARQVAERAWIDGHIKALALIPSGEWGDRMLATFTQQWEALGGTLLEVQRYDASQHDFSEPVVDLLNIDRSRARYYALRSLLGIDIKFEGRRRQDADFIFVAAFPAQARQIRPQLRFYFAADLPVYSTSQSYSGEVNTSLDRDLDGILFCDMPWTLTNGAGHKPDWQEFLNAWKSSAIPFKRLYAMGIDAYSLMQQIGHIGYSPADGLNGETGDLYFDSANRIHRQLTWARFRNGRPVIVQETSSPDPLPDASPDSIPGSIPGSIPDATPDSTPTSTPTSTPDPS